MSSNHAELLVYRQTDIEVIRNASDGEAQTQIIL